MKFKPLFSARREWIILAGSQFLQSTPTLISASTGEAMPAAYLPSSCRANGFDVAQCAAGIVLDYCMPVNNPQ
jgi:hypothetical protein